MNKRGGFDLQMYIISVLLVVGIVVSFGTAFMSMATKYGVSTTDATSFTNTYDKLDEISAFTEQADSQISSSQLDDESQQNTFLGDMLAAGKTIYGTIGIPQAMLTDVVTRFGVPNVWYVIFTAMIVVLFATTLIFLVFANRG